MKKVFTLMAIFATMVFTLSCKQDNPSKPDDQKDDSQEEPQDPPQEEPVNTVNIVIDGNFEDWANVDESVGAAVAKNNANSPWEGVKEIRCYATPDFVYYYIKFDQASLKEALEEVETPEIHIRLNINTDGEFTSGYTSYSLDGYDFIIEGSLAEEGAFVEYAGTLHQRIDGWKELCPSSGGVVTGKGAGSEYEIMLFREVFNNAVAGSPSPNSPMGDVFHTGIRFYWNGWDEFSNMPNASVDEGEGNGYAHLMEVTTVK